VRRARLALTVVVGYLDHGPPDLRAIAAPGSVVVPLLLSSGHHVQVDIPEHAPGCRVTAPVGPDPLLLPVLARRLVAAGWDGSSDVTLAAAGSREETALDEVRALGRSLAGLLSARVTTSFIADGEPRFRDVASDVVASYLLAPGHFHDVLARSGASVVSEPVGDAPELARIVLSRYDVSRDEPLR
jgi:sirohydrochlorin ferrochelatase